MKISETYFVYGSHFSVFIVGRCQNIIKIETEEMKDCRRNSRSHSNSDCWLNKEMQEVMSCQVEAILRNKKNEHTYGVTIWCIKLKRVIQAQNFCGSKSLNLHVLHVVMLTRVCTRQTNICGASHFTEKLSPEFRSLI